mmetsp:Transcript_3240/g.1932  ORF Transcript_3240/g.1932 Transcript_3240/m.1932 type:complete len:121 (-) Transcript_3240:759-1121(-)
MPRPFKKRMIAFQPKVTFFKPQGISLRHLEFVKIGEDELEAVRLADLKGLYHADAAEQMHVSRQTFGNILSAAHRKIAEALINGKAIQVVGNGVAIQTDDDKFSSYPSCRENCRYCRRKR